MMILLLIISTVVVTCSIVGPMTGNYLFGPYFTGWIGGSFFMTLVMVLNELYRQDTEGEEC